MADFHERLPKLLKPGGVYSFFMGLAPGKARAFIQSHTCSSVIQNNEHKHPSNQEAHTHALTQLFYSVLFSADNLFFHTVEGRVAQLELQELGLSTTYERVGDFTVNSGCCVPRLSPSIHHTHTIARCCAGGHQGGDG